MEYLKHGDLQHNLDKPLPEAEAQEITFQVLEGLNFMHKSDYAHRDLKPGVSLVTPWEAERILSHHWNRIFW